MEPGFFGGRRRGCGRCCSGRGRSRQSSGHRPLRRRGCRGNPDPPNFQAPPPRQIFLQRGVVVVGGGEEERTDCLGHCWGWVSRGSGGCYYWGSPHLRVWSRSLKFSSNWVGVVPPPSSTCVGNKLFSFHGCQNWQWPQKPNSCQIPELLLKIGDW